MKHAFIYHNQETKLFIVQIAKKISWQEEGTLWQADSDLGDICLVPSIDIKEENKIFYTQEEAENALAEHYAKQIKEIK
jgi:hypothetical protein